MTSPMIRILSLYGFFLAASPALAGDTRHVRTNGDNAQGQGTEAKPWKTIAHALLKARPGDTVQVGAGTFRERLEIRKAGNVLRPVTVKGTKSAKGEYQTILDGSTEVPNQWEDQGGGVYRTQLAQTKAMTAQGYAIWRCGDHAWQDSSKCWDTLNIPPDEVWNIAVGAVKYWDRGHRRAVWVQRWVDVSQVPQQGAPQGYPRAGGAKWWRRHHLDEWRGH